MDRLIEDYERALTEEFELREPVNRFSSHVTDMEIETRVRLIIDDPKLPQWKAGELAQYALDRDEQYQDFRRALKQAEKKHLRARIQVAVTSERLKLARARLYGGRHEPKETDEG